MFRCATHAIEARNPSHVCKGVKSVAVDGQAVTDRYVPAFADGRAHNVKVQKPDLLGVHRGAVAEQFAGQELMACTPPNREPGLWFWTREALNSQAEIDYVIAPKGIPVPIEVKPVQPRQMGIPRGPIPSA